MFLFFICGVLSYVESVTAFVFISKLLIQKNNMALEEFEKDPMAERHKGYLRMRSIMDYGMGILWIAMGLFFVLNDYLFRVDLSDRFDPAALKVFGALCVLYGGFRVYRGYKKNYLRER